ncbi:MAG: hypothetical protein Q9174_000557 [Haloplaca sp. 1 TL-2023]
MNPNTTFPSPSGLPPIQTLVRPEQIPKLANLPEERKAQYIQGVGSLWDRIKSHPPESQEYQLAYRRLHEASESLKKHMAQLGSVHNGQRPPNAAQQPPNFRPSGQQTGSGASNLPIEALSQRVQENIKRFPFLVPPEMVAHGPDRVQVWLRQIKQKYGNILQSFETAQTKLAELNNAQQQQQKEGKHVTPQEAQHWNNLKIGYERTSHHARDLLSKFKMSQDNIRANQKGVSTVGTNAATLPKGPSPLAASSAEHPQSILDSHPTAAVNTVSDHQGQAHTVSSALDAARNHSGSAGRPSSSAEKNGQNNQGAIDQAASTQAPEGQAVNEHSQGHQNNNHTSNAPPQHQSPQAANSGPNMPPGPHPLSHQAAISQSARNYSQHTVHHSAAQASTHSHPQLSGREPQTSNTKMPITKDLKVPQPQPVTMGPARPSLTGGPSNGATGPMGQPAIQKHPGYVLEGDGERVLGRKKLEELVRQVTGGVDGEEGETLSAAAEETLLDVADDFVDQVVTAACRLAKMRASQTLELRDVQLVLERNYNIRIPGYASDELRTVKKVQPTAAWTQKLAAVQAAKVTGGKSDK